jgi:hypothetical protein
MADFGRLARVMDRAPWAALGHLDRQMGVSCCPSRCPSRYRQLVRPVLGSSLALGSCGGILRSLSTYSGRPFGGRLGVTFRRQVPLGPFIVDFLAPSARLVVEVDGGYHELRAKADARRTRWLERRGYRVLRGFGGQRGA